LFESRRKRKRGEPGKQQEESMTYSPGSPGYPPAQQQPSGYPAAAPAATPDFAKEPGESKLLQYLTYALVGFGLAAYFASFGPSVAGGALTVVAVLLAALLAAVGLVPKASSYLGVVTAISVLGLLLAIVAIVNSSSDVPTSWAMYLVLTFALLQAVTAVAALLLEAGVITPPAPKPKYDPYQQQYGQYGQQYPQQQYGQQQPYYGQQAPPAGYGAQQQYGGYGSSPSQGQPNQSNIPTQNAIPTSVAKQASGGFGAHPSPQSGPQPTVVTGSQSGPQPTVVTGSQPSAPAPTLQTPTTPPTGFPSYGTPPSSSAGGGSPAGSAPVNYSTPSSNQTQTYGQGQQSPGSAPV
jgi:hypothetical protein